MTDDRADRLSQRIPLKFRAIAALLHALFAIIMGLSVSFYLWMIFIGSNDMSSRSSLMMTIVFYLMFVSLPLIVVLPVMSWTIWLITKDLDPFVDLAGRDAINYALNNLILILGLTVMIVAISNFLSKLKYFHEVSSTILLLGVATFVMSSAVAGIFALRGYRFKNSLIHPFIRDNR